MAAGIPIRFKMSPHLAERVRAVCEYLNLTAEGLAEYALEQEVTRQEVYKIRDEITIQEIGKNILGEGQSLHIQVRDENDEYPEGSLLALALERAHDFWVMGRGTQALLDELEERAAEAEQQEEVDQAAEEADSPADEN